MIRSGDLGTGSQTVVTLRDHAAKKATATRTDLDEVRRAQRYVDAVTAPARGTGAVNRPAVVVEMATWCASDAAREVAFRALFAAVQATELPPRTPLIEPSHVWQMPSEKPRA